jgi:hypothetical protein
MARGFESKDIEFQQAEASRTALARPPSTPADRERASRRRTVELTLSRVRAERSVATHPSHCSMLDRAIEALEHDLEALR